jgi:hypothetical protein
MEQALLLITLGVLLLGSGPINLLDATLTA